MSFSILSLDNIHTHHSSLIDQKFYQLNNDNKGWRLLGISLLTGIIYSLAKGILPVVGASALPTEFNSHRKFNYQKPIHYKLIPYNLLDPKIPGVAVNFTNLLCPKEVIELPLSQEGYNSQKMSCIDTIELDGTVKLINHKITSNEYVTFTKVRGESSKAYIYAGIAECDGKLITFEQTFSPDHFILTHVSLLDNLWKALKEHSSFKRNSYIDRVITHFDFEKYLPEFVKNIFSLDTCSQLPYLFSFFNDDNIVKILKLLISKGHIDDNNIVKLFKEEVFTDSFAKNAAFNVTKIISDICENYPDTIEAQISYFINQYIIHERDLGEINSIIGKLNNKPKYFDLLKQIIEGQKTNQDFYNGINTLSLSDKKILYQAAYSYNNPFLHEPAQSKIEPTGYSVNLIWLNINATHQEFLLGTGATKEERALDFHKKFVSPVTGWSMKNPGSRINIWIDDQKVDLKTLERTHNAIKTVLHEDAYRSIYFRDIHSLDLVRMNPKLFTSDIPIYFQVDLIRAIAADQILKLKESELFVYGDLDMEPMGANELFDQRTLSYLNDYGFVMGAANSNLGFENGFYILNGSHMQLMRSHREAIIDYNLETALNAFKVAGKNFRKEMQRVYYSYPAMFTHFILADGRFGQPAYDDLLEMAYKSRDFVDFPVNIPKCYSKKWFHLKNFMPKKPVPIPPSEMDSYQGEGIQNSMIVKKI